MGRKKKQKPSEQIMEGWTASLDAKVFKRFGVKIRTGLNIFSMEMVTDFPEGLDPQSVLMIRNFIEGWSWGTLRCQAILTIHEGTRDMPTDVEEDEYHLLPPPPEDGPGDPGED